MNTITTNFIDSSGADLGIKLVSKNYLISVYPQLTNNYTNLYLWGRGLSGELGDNQTAASRSTPQQLTNAGAAGWRSITSCYNSLAIKSDGTLWAWGPGDSGENGDGTTQTRSTPRQIGAATNWREVTFGNFQCSAAIKTDGTLWSWGFNGSGTVGDGTTANRSSPRQVGTATNWKQVSHGGSAALGVKTDGTLWGWGGNDYGEVGDGTGNTGVAGQNTRSTPTQVGTATNWRFCCAQGNTSAAIKTDGTLWLWGRGANGALGNNLTTNRNTPIQEFTSTSQWEQVAMIGTTIVAVIAVKKDGTLWSWGNGANGVLGDNQTASRSTPAQVGTENTWKAICSGTTSAMAIKVNGTLWTWGSNANGRLGVNDTITRSTPVQEFTSSTNWKTIRGTNGQMSAIKSVDLP